MNRIALEDLGSGFTLNNYCVGYGANRYFGNAVSNGIFNASIDHNLGQARPIDITHLFRISTKSDETVSALQSMQSKLSISSLYVQIVDYRMNYVVA